MVSEIEGDHESRHYSVFSRNSKRGSGTPPSSAHSTQIREPIEELDPGAVVLEDIFEQKLRDEIDTTALPASSAVVEKTIIPPGTEKALSGTTVPSTTTAPIQISKPVGSSLSRPHDESDLSTSPSSVVTNSSSSQISSSGPGGKDSSPSRGGLWNRIKGKTGSRLKNATSLKRLTSRNGKPRVKFLKAIHLTIAEEMTLTK